MMNFVGVDACKNGWFAVALDRQDNWNIAIFKTIDALGSAFQSAAAIFIDMPIGLPDDNRRRCDTETRKILNRRASCVFPVPCREALHARTYRQACRINQQALGVKLTIQTWDISAKIASNSSSIGTVPLNPPLDKKGLPMEIVYAVPG